MAVTPLYASILAFVYIALAYGVIRNRYRFEVSLGDGGHTKLNRMIRGHGNFSEYVPIALLLMVIAEMANADKTIIHLIGATLLSGRLLHAYALALTDANMFARRSGMILTFTAIVIGAGTCLTIGLGV
ncbi:MAG: MAPEG family protein [Rhodospirillales bacterium]|nr:MAPEG family protein [Rhodospirillales bacterium]